MNSKAFKYASMAHTIIKSQKTNNELAALATDDAKRIAITV